VRQHRGHNIIHLSKVYQENKNKILNELAKFDNKIELFRKNGVLIKQELQKLHVQVSQKKSFIEEYFVGLIERIDEEYKDKKERVEGRYDENLQEIEFL
jgi:metal-dependent hydrolase (beta-lactamase superfamily II)